MSATDRQLADTILEALKLRAEMLAGGASLAEVRAGFEQVVREAWPKGRSEPWRDLCGECRDYGWRIYECAGDAACGREKPHLPHTYATACWCAKGRLYQVKPKQEVDELAQVAKTSKPTRFGRQ